MHEQAKASPAEATVTIASVVNPMRRRVTGIIASDKNNSRQTET
jgi:hypothetical protein